MQSKNLTTFVRLQASKRSRDSSTSCRTKDSCNPVLIGRLINQEFYVKYWQNE